jgi:hypothetical protein
MPKPGRDVNGIARTEADLHMKCPACGQWVDMRDLAQVLAHIHDQEQAAGSESSALGGSCWNGDRYAITMRY